MLGLSFLETSNVLFPSLNKNMKFSIRLIYYPIFPLQESCSSRLLLFSEILLITRIVQLNSQKSQIGDRRL